MKNNLFVKWAVSIAIAVFIIVEIVGICWSKATGVSYFSEMPKWIIFGVVFAAVVCVIIYFLVGAITSCSAGKKEKK